MPSNGIKKNSNKMKQPKINEQIDVTIEEGTQRGSEYNTIKLIWKVTFFFAFKTIN